MTGEPLEREVSRALHELFPEPHDVALRMPPARSRRRRLPQALAITGPAAAIAAIAIIASLRLIPGAFSAAVGPATAGQSAGPTATAVARPAAAARPTGTPAWARACLPRKRQYRLGPATEYLGLTVRAAVHLARRRGYQLLFVGGGGHCDSIPEPRAAVAYRYVVALVLDKSDAAPGMVAAAAHSASTRSASARVIAAERVSYAWQGPGIGK